jgi:trans-2,3-dihydro-3-hydroxyanthranilate isomerase
MEAEFSLIDVFSDRPFGGNQLAVFPGAEGLSDAQSAPAARARTAARRAGPAVRT